MISYEAPQSEFSFDNRGPVTTTLDNNINRPSSARSRSKSRDRVAASGEHLRPLSSNPVQPENIPPPLSGGSINGGDDLDEDLDAIPPVPKIPPKLGKAIPGAYPESQDRVPTLGTTGAGAENDATHLPGETPRDRVGRSLSRGLKSRTGGSSLAGPEPEVVDLQTLLKGIASGGGEAENGSVGRPPY